MQSRFVLVTTMTWGKMYRLRLWIIYAPVCLLALAAFFWFSLVVFPPAPTHITITSGSKDGMYFRHAQNYAKVFAEFGVTADVVESAGTAQNIERLRDIDNPAQIGFLQGGFGQQDRAKPSENRTNIQTIANIDIEPVWIFARNKEIDSLLQLQGTRVSIGQVGSGSRLVAIKLLEQVKLEPKDLIESENTGLSAVKALSNGSIDAAIFVASAEAPVTQAMLQAKGVHLITLKRSAALIERMPYLEPRLVGQGLLNPQNALPEQDSVMLTTIASVVVSENLHPSLKRLTAAVARRVHAKEGLFHRAGDFPNLKRVDYPSAPDARNTLQHDLHWVELHLPFLWSQWLWRILLIGIPLATICMALCYGVPAFLRWTIESHVNRWYGELKYIEHDLENAKLSGLDFTRHHGQLRAIDSALDNFEAPPEFMKRLFMLQKHTDFVRTKLLSMRGR
jgi:uncharacterized protein